ncbi:MAG: hypothetical protein ACXWNK_07560 [Vulcanimicrobiaceae bacterium]
MNIDLRLPVGVLFLAIGSIMVLFGITSNPALYDRSLGINVNVWWGAVEVAFGGLMLLLALRARRRG